MPGLGDLPANEFSAVLEAFLGLIEAGIPKRLDRPANLTERAYRALVGAVRSKLNSPQRRPRESADP
jgi:hypothetical protein